MKPYAKIVAILVGVLLSMMLLVCKANVLKTDPEAVVRAMFYALNKGRAEDATKYFTEESQIITFVGQPKGIKKINDFFKLSWIPLKSHFEIKEININEENVTGIFTIKNISPEFATPTKLKLIAVIVNGKIIKMTWTAN